MQCELCHKEFGKITIRHLNSHNIGFKEYKDQFPNARINEYRIPWNKGKHGIYSEKTKILMGADKIGKSSWNKGIPTRDETKLKYRLKRKGSKNKQYIRTKPFSPNSGCFKKGLTPPFKGKKLSSELKNRISKTVLKLYEDKNYKDEITRKSIEASRKRPTVAELMMGYILNSCCPNEFAYNGDHSCKTRVNGLVPDYININGKKKVIEVFSDYYHDPILFKKIKYNGIEGNRINTLKEVGYDCLVIWEKELKDGFCFDVSKRVRDFLYV